MTKIGELVGRGRTSDVFAFGVDSVIKVPHAEVPNDWAPFEAKMTAAVRASGAPAPEVRDVVEVDGRNAVIFERVHGRSMWQLMCDAPDDCARFAADFVAIHRSLLSVGLPEGLPDLVDRMARKIGVAEALEDQHRREGVAILDSLPRGAALLHGDLHPGNILMREGGPVVIDWFDAAVGHPVADIVRSSLLVRPSRVAAPRHLPGASGQLLGELHDLYLQEFAPELEAAREHLAAWQAVVAASRLAEHADIDEQALLELWSARAARA